MKLSKQNLPLKPAKTVLQILRKVKDATDKYHSERIELLTANCEKNEEGNPRLDDNNNFIIPEDNQKTVNDTILSMMNKDVRFPKLKLAEMEEARLSAQELSLIEDLVS
jgi:hypothetical protein